MKKIIGLLTVLMMAGMVTGCIEVKELTEEEEARISEYAATVLLKYDANYKNLLWEETEEEEPEELEAEEKQEEEKQEETVSGQAVVKEESGQEQKPENRSFGEIFNIPGIDIQYTGSKFVKNFPEGGNNGYMIQAEEGKKLLVLTLQVTNTTSETISVDLLSDELSFRIHFNEEEIIAKMTILLEDFSTMAEDVPAGASVEKVLIGEVTENFSEELSNLSITTRMHGAIYMTFLVP